CVAMSAIVSTAIPRWTATSAGASATARPPGGAAPVRPAPRELEEEQHGEEGERPRVMAVADRADRGEDNGDEEDRRDHRARGEAAGAVRDAAPLRVLVGEVGEQGRELGAGAGRVAALEALLQLVGVQPAVEMVAAQLLGDALAVGVRGPHAGGWSCAAG